MTYSSSKKQLASDAISALERAYISYTLRQLEAVESSRGKQLKAFWQKQLNKCPVLNLPFDFPRPDVSTFKGDVYLDILDVASCYRLNQLAETCSSDSFSILLSIFYIFLGRLTGQTDLVVGIPTSTSNYGLQDKNDNLVGMIANSLLCRINLSNRLSFQALLKQVEQALEVVYAHRDYPLWLLAQEGHCQSAKEPLISVAFSWETQYIIPKQSFITTEEDLIIEPYPLGEQRGGSFDLYLTVLETPQGLQLCWKYSSDLFKHKSIVQFAKRFRVLLSAVLADSEQPVLQLSYLTKTERDRLLQPATGGFLSPLQETIHTLFEAQVQRTPDAVAIIFEGEFLSYQQLNQRANQLARYLQANRLQPETLVGVYLHRSINLIVALLGVLKSGAAYLPLNPDLPQERLDYMLSAGDVDVLISESHLFQDSTGSTFRTIYLDTDWHYITQQSDQNVDSLVTPRNLAYVIYTSGSTGRPKGVMIEHQSVSNFIRAAIAHYELTSADRVLQFASIGFDAAVEEIYPCLSVGGTLILRPTAMLDSMSAFLQQCQDYRLTILDLPTAFWHQLVDFLLTTPDIDIPDLIRLVIIGGEKVDAQHVCNWYSRLNHAPLVVNTYGPTEATVVATAYKISAAQFLIDSSEHPKSISIGKALDNIETYILDQQLQLVPPGVVGELYIGGAALARGYLNAPEQTKARFIAHPFRSEAQARLYKTGDLVRHLPDGNLDYICRADYQVKIRGYRVELGEIESTITQYTQVKQALVLAHQTSIQSQRLIAYVVVDLTSNCLTSAIGSLNPKESVKASKKAFKQGLKKYMAAKLPNYMVPSAIVLMDTLPLTANGKVDRNALPMSLTNDDLGEHIPPQELPSTQTEKQIAQLWQKILGNQPIGIYSSFLELGGNSLQVIEILTQIQRYFAADVSTQAFLENPTIAQLTTLIMAQESVHPQAMTPDLSLEARLDDTIQFDHLSMPQSLEIKNIFLTGATGSIGPYLLSELLQQTVANLYCLVRAENDQVGRNKIVACLKAARRWQPLFQDRIIPVCGDLSKPLLGLAQLDFEKLANRIDVIYHNGAWVNFIYNYTSLKATNVLGTQEVLRLAGYLKLKPVHYVSTLSIFSEPSEGQTTILETDLPSSIGCLDSGYDQTKCVAEHLVKVAKGRGLPVSVYRLGTVLSYDFQNNGDNLSPNFFQSLIQDCFKLQKVPNLEQIINITPIDYISRAIALLSIRQSNLNQTFHVINPNYLTWNEFVDELIQLSPALQKVSYSEWLTQLCSHIQHDKQSLLKPFLSLLDVSVDFPLENLHFDCKNTQQGLTGTPIDAPVIDAKLLENYWKKLLTVF